VCCSRGLLRRGHATAMIPPAALCSDSGSGPPCLGSKQDLKAARQAFRRGIKLEKSHIWTGDYEFQAAANLVPQNIEYLTAQELTRQHLPGFTSNKGTKTCSRISLWKRWLSSAPR